MACYIMQFGAFLPRTLFISFSNQIVSILTWPRGLTSFFIVSLQYFLHVELEVSAFITHEEVKKLENTTIQIYT